MLWTLVWKTHLLTIWPWPFNPQTMSLLRYPKVIPYTKFENIEIIRFWVMLRTIRQTGGLEHPTHTDSHPHRLRLSRAGNYTQSKTEFQTSKTYYKIYYVLLQSVELLTISDMVLFPWSCAVDVCEQPLLLSTFAEFTLSACERQRSATR